MGSERGSGNGSATSISVGRRPRSKVWIGFSITLVVVLLFSATAARADPGVTCKCANCAPTCSGGCPKGTVGITVSMAVTNPTNVTVKVTVSVNSTVYFYWGNTTNYGFTLLGGTWFPSSSLTHSYFIDFLEPSTTYYYEVKASTKCYYGGTDQGSWQTGSDSMTTFSGVIQDVSGNKAPQDTSVIAWCYNSVDNYHWTAQAFVQSTTTGQYSLTAWNGCSPPNGNGYHVAVLLGGTYLGYLADAWYGHWNETVVTWAPQVVNFYLPTTFTGPTIVNYALFTNSNEVNLEFCKYTSSSYSYTTSTTSTWGIAGFSGSTTSTVQVGGSFESGFCSKTLGEPSDEEWGGFNMSGGILVDNVHDRTVSDAWVQYYGDKTGGGLGSGGPLSNPVTEPSGNAAACHAGGVAWYKQEIGPNSVIPISLGASGTVSQLGSDTFSFNLGGLLAPLILIPGIGEVASVIDSMVSASATWQYSWSTTLTNQFNVTATIATGSSAGVFTVACQGSTSPGEGLAVEVWQDS